MIRLIINAENLILGRMASRVAQELLRGEAVVIINAEKSIISGSKKNVIERYKKRLERKSIVNPARHGPFFPRKPEGIVKRAVRGMLPIRRTKGREALKNLRVYIGIPKELEGKEMVTLENANVTKLRVPKYIKVGELSSFLGAEF